VGAYRIRKGRDKDKSGLDRKYPVFAIPSSSSSMVVDVTVPWHPHLRRRWLKSHPEVDIPAVQIAEPSVFLDPEWSKAALEAVLKKTPQAVVPLWDCVLSIWRLKKTGPDERPVTEELIWRDLVIAWTVRPFFLFFFP
jgi:hypothetical protein